MFVLLSLLGVASWLDNPHRGRSLSRDGPRVFGAPGGCSRGDRAADTAPHRHCLTHDVAGDSDTDDPGG